jgi:hypothetical protein
VIPGLTCEHGWATANPDPCPLCQRGVTARYVADEAALREALAEPLARALGEFNNSPEWTSPVGSVGLDDEAAFRAAQGRWEEQEEERQAQTEAMRWALEQPAVLDALTRIVQPREDAVREAKAEALREVMDGIKPGDHDCFKSWCPHCAVRKEREMRWRWLRDRAAALTPGTDRPAAEDGPRNTGTGSAT